MKPQNIIRPIGRVHGGAAVPHRKNTAEFDTSVLPCPERVYIPMQMHIGSPCVPVVKVGDKVKIGDIIGNSDAYVSAPVHASISGTVSKIDSVPAQNGGTLTAVVIDSDGLSEYSEKLVPRNDIDTSEELIAAARECGLVGLGGAGFPTHIKLSPKDGVRLDTLIINAAECEPYITTDYRECMENSEDIIGGIYLVKKCLNIENVYIAVEDNKPKAIEKLSEIASKLHSESGKQVKIVCLKSRYPQGAEKVLIQAVTGRRVPMGALPADVGCIVMNVTSVSILNRYVKTGIPLVEKRITVDGSAVKNPQNVTVPIGTKISDVISFCGGYKSEPGKIIMGGPMMGMAQTDDSVVVQKQNNAVTVLDKNDGSLGHENPCIRCGLCSSSCPMHLMPTLIARYAKVNDAEALKRIGVSVCMECGSCAYNCPANRPLVQYMRNAKSIYRKGMQNK